MGIALEFRSWYNLRFDFPQSRTKECFMTRLHYDTDLTIFNGLCSNPCCRLPKRRGANPSTSDGLWNLVFMVFGKPPVGEWGLFFFQKCVSYPRFHVKTLRKTDDKEKSEPRTSLFSEKIAYNGSEWEFRPRSRLIFCPLF